MFLGIDIGTTSVSVVILNQRRQLLACANKAHHADLDTVADQSEQSPQKILQTTTQALLSLDEKLRQQITAIGITGQMHGVLFIDHNKQPLSPLITWQDKRCLADGFLSDIRARTGYPLNSGYGCATLAWLVHHRAVPAFLFKCCTIADYLAMHLAGLPAPYMDATQAASWGCFDLAAGQWDKRAMQQLGIHTEWLPEIKSCSFAGLLSPEGADKWKLPPARPITTALGDNQASLLATLENPEEELALTLGTGGQVSAVVADYDQSDRSLISFSNCELRPFPGNRFLVTAAILCGGSAWAWLAETVQKWQQELGRPPCDEHFLYQRLNELGLAANDDLVFTPHFSGERDAAQLRAAIQGISLSNFSLGQVSRSLAHGIMKNLKDRLPPFIFTGRLRLMASGNALRRNPLLQQMAQQVFNLPLILSPYEEEAACGAAIHAHNMLEQRP